MGDGSIERAYSEALEHAMVLREQRGSRRKAGKIGEVFERTSALGNMMVEQLDPTGGAKAAIWVCVKAWEHLESQERQHEVPDDLLENLIRIIPTIESIKDVADANVRETVKEIMKLIEDTLGFVLSDRPRSRSERALQNVFGSTGQEESDALVQRSERLRREFDQRVTAQVLREGEIHRRREKLKELRPVELAGYDPSRQCLDGTRVGIIDTLTAWTQSENRSTRLAWVHGLAGLGKSSIMTSVCKRLDDQGVLACSFFCKRDTPDLRDPRRVLTTIVCELAQRWEAYATAVVEVISKNVGLHSKHIRPLYDILVTEPWKAISHAEQPKHALTVIVDALDECGDAITRRQLLACLRDVSQIAPFLRVIVTSRPDEDIRAYFQDVTSDWHTEFNLMQYDATADIRLFVQQQLSPLVSVKGWPADAVEILTARASGLFIWARTACAYILQGLDKLKRLRLATDGSRLDAIDSLYETILTADIIGDEEDMNDMRRCLGAIVVTSMRSALSVVDLAALMSEHASEELLQSVVDRLAAVLYTDDKLGGAIRISHPSFMDYITNPGRSRNLCVELPEHNLIITGRCLRVMVSELKFNICGLETSGLLNRDVHDLDTRVGSAIGPHLSYACVYWMSHLAEVPTGTTLGSTLRNLLSGPQLVYWIEALSLLGELSVAPTGLLSIIEWCKANGLQDCSKLAHDAYRFVLAFYDAIFASTPHLYISALALAPTDSYISQHVRELFPNLLRVIQGGDRDWSTCVRSISAPSGVRSVAVLPNGKCIVSGSEDGKVCIWDVRTGEATRAPLQGHSLCVTSVAISPDGRRIVSGSEDRALLVWDVGTGEVLLGPLKGHSDVIESVAYSPDGRLIASGSRDGTGRIWDAETGGVVGKPLLGHVDHVLSICFAPDCSQLATGSGDGNVGLWKIGSGKTKLLFFMVHQSRVRAMDFSPSGQRVAAGYDDGSVRIWCTKTEKEVIEPMTAPGLPSILSVAFSPCGRYVVSCSLDNTILVRNVENGAVVLGPLSGHTDWIYSVKFSPNGDCIVSGSKDKAVRVWESIHLDTASVDVEQGPHSIVGSLLPFNSVPPTVLSSDGQRIVAGLQNSSICIWDTEAAQLVLGPLECRSDSICSIALSPDNTIVACGCTNGTIHMWDAESGKSLREPLQTDCSSSITFSHDGQKMATSRAGKLRVWNSTTGTTTTSPLINLEKRVNAITFLHDGRQVAVVSTGFVVSRCDVETGETTTVSLEKDLVPGPVWCTAISSDGLKVACGFRNGTILVWNVEKGEIAFDPLTGHSDGVLSVAFSLNNKCLVSASIDRSIRIWDTETGSAVLNPLLGHRHPVRRISISPDSHRIVSVSSGTICAWDVESFMIPSISTVFLPDTPIPMLPPSEDGEQLVLGAQLARHSTRDSYGWAKTSEGHLLLWLPHEMREVDDSLISISSDGVRRRTIIDFGDFVHGELWTSVTGAGSGSVTSSE
ncbi:hypothetical protein RhiJN_14859 [Ceratobasidium sp. AG-Ba]|nr:hypothetical protein RhiJN_14859 [Ceratobasidium sp. AG-Ba]